MIIIYVSRLGGSNADVSYNTAWEGLWGFAEISFGIIVACTFSLPKLLDAKGSLLRSVLSSFARPFTSLTSGGSFGRSSSARRDTRDFQDVAHDRATTTADYEAELSVIHRYEGSDIIPSEGDEYGSTKTLNASTGDTSSR